MLWCCFFSFACIFKASRCAYGKWTLNVVSLV